MKYFITILFISLCITASAQTKDVNIHDNGKTLNLKYKSGSGDNQVNFDNTYDVSGLSKQQKDLLIRRVIDSVSLHGTPAKTDTKSPAYQSIKIDDDGNNLTLSVDYRSAGQSIKFTDTYNVKGKTKEEKDEMVKKVLDGLGIKK